MTMDRDEAKRTLETMPFIIGHRGAATHALENTLAGLRRARSDGATWVEFDVKLTADHIPILMHDETLERTTSGRGRVADMPSSELKTLSAAKASGPEYDGELIPTFQDALDLLVELGLGANVEIKPCPGRVHDTTAITLDYLLARWPSASPWPLISSFSDDALESARVISGAIPRGLLMTSLTRDWRERAERLGCSTIHLDHRSLDENTVNALSGQPWPIVAYTVNDVERARDLLTMGVRAVITDDPGKLIGALNCQ